MENQNQFRYPTPAELYAIEKTARRMRAAEMARVLGSLAAALKRLVARVTSSHTKGMGHA